MPVQKMVVNEITPKRDLELVAWWSKCTLGKALHSDEHTFFVISWTLQIDDSEAICSRGSRGLISCWNSFKDFFFGKEGIVAVIKVFEDEHYPQNQRRTAGNSPECKLNRIFQLLAKTMSDRFAEFSEVLFAENVFPALWRPYFVNFVNLQTSIILLTHLRLVFPVHF